MNITKSAGADLKSSSETIRPSTLGKSNAGALVSSGSIVLGVNAIAISPELEADFDQCSILWAAARPHHTLQLTQISLFARMTERLPDAVRRPDEIVGISPAAPAGVFIWH